MSRGSSHNPASAPGPVERALRHDRAIVIGAICALTVLAAAYTLLAPGMPMSALEMTGMAGPIGRPMIMAMAPAWSPGYFFVMFLMWWIMMIAMMTPSAAPAILLFAALKRQGGNGGGTFVVVGLFLVGYLLAWGGFSLVATLLQWALQPAGLISPMMMTLSSRIFAGGLLVLAGLYQLSPLKDICLDHCRAPAQFLSEHRRPGLVGALKMGAHHGSYCLGCCWALMALLFVGGIMNLYWIVGLAVIVAVEKLAPGGRIIARVLGLGMIFLGGVVLIG